MSNAPNCQETEIKYSIQFEADFSFPRNHTTAEEKKGT